MPTTETLRSASHPIQPWDRRLIAADLAELPSDVPSGPIDYELDDGRLIVVAPFTCEQGAIRSNIAAHLAWQGEHKAHGRAWGRVAIVLWRNPDRVVIPDAVFIANKSLPICTTAEDYLLTIPELVVEVRGRRDAPAYANRKVEHYLQAGVEIVWVVDPTAKTVTVHSANGDIAACGMADALTLPAIIPDFSLAVSNVFRE